MKALGLLLIAGVGAGLGVGLSSYDPATIDFDGESVVWFGGAYGQSNSIPRGTTRVSTDSPPNARMFNAGVWPHKTDDVAYVSDTLANENQNPYIDLRFASLIPYQEYTDLESLNAGIAHVLSTRDILLASFGSGAKTVDDLSGGMIFLETFAVGVSRATELLSDEDLRIRFLPIPYFQGEAEADAGVPGSTWIDRVIALQRHMTDIAAAQSGQAVSTIPFITMQMVNTRYNLNPLADCISIMQAQSDIATMHADVYSIGPSYWTETVDNVHYTEAYRRYISDKAGEIILAGASWTHTRIVSASVAGQTITVSVHVPFGSLTEDTTLVSSISNKGFEVFDAGSSALMISSVTVGATVSQTATVTIVIASGTPATLRYALQDLVTGGRTNGARGNLRDQDPFVSTLDGHPLYNWLAAAEVAL